MNFQKLLPLWFLLSIALMVGLHLLLPVHKLLLPPVNYLGLVA